MGAFDNSFTDEFGEEYSLNMSHSSKPDIDVLDIITSMISLLVLGTVFFHWISIRIHYVVGRSNMGMSLWKLLFKMDFTDEIYTFKIIFIILCIVQLVSVILRHLPGGKGGVTYPISAVLGMLVGFCIIVCVIYFMLTLHSMIGDIENMISQGGAVTGIVGSMFKELINAADSYVSLTVRAGLWAWIALALGIVEFILSLLQFLKSKSGSTYKAAPNMYNMNDDDFMSI